MRQRENRRIAFLIVVAYVALTMSAIIAVGAYAAHTKRQLAATDRRIEANARRIEAVQDQACIDLADIVRRYNRQYDLVIVQSLSRVLRRHPADPVAVEVLAAFQRPDFPTVKPPRCG